MRLQNRKSIVLDEFYYKYVIIFFGIIYWIYGMMPSVDLIFNLLSLMAVAVSVVYFFTCKSDFRKGFAVFIVLFNILTIVANPFKMVNVIALIYIWIEVFFFMYCDEQKESSILMNELDSFCKLITILGTFIVIASLVTYTLGINVVYGYPSITTTTLHLGIDSSSGALVGIMGNANIFANYLVVYIGVLIHYVYKNGIKVSYVILMAVGLGTLYLSYSRGGLVGIAVLIAIVVLVPLVEKAKGNQGMLLILAGAYICFLLFVLMIVMGLRIDLNGINGRDIGQATRSTNLRVMLWIAGIKGTCSNPIYFLFGVGANIAELIRQFADPSIPSSLYNNVHNIYVATFASYGFFGVVLFIGLIATTLIKILHMLMQSIKTNRDMIPFVAILISLLVINLVESDIYVKKPFEGTGFWLILGYTYCILKKRECEGKSKRIIEE